MRRQGRSGAANGGSAMMMERCCSWVTEVEARHGGPRLEKGVEDGCKAPLERAKHLRGFGCGFKPHLLEWG